MAPNKVSLLALEETDPSKEPIVITPEMLTNLVTQIFSKTNERIASYIVTSITDSADNKHVPSALAVLNMIKALKPTMECKTVIGKIEDVETSPNTHTIYLQKDDATTDKTWTIYLYIENKFVAIGDSNVDLVNYWSKNAADITALRELILNDEEGKEKFEEWLAASEETVMAWVKAEGYLKTTAFATELAKNQETVEGWAKEQAEEAIDEAKTKIEGWADAKAQAAKSAALSEVAENYVSNDDLAEKVAEELVEALGDSFSGEEGATLDEVLESMIGDAVDEAKTEVLESVELDYLKKNDFGTTLNSNKNTVDGWIDAKLNPAMQNVADNYVSNEDLEEKVTSILGGYTGANSEDDNFAKAYGITIGNGQTKEIELFVDSEVVAIAESITDTTTIKQVVSYMNTALASKSYTASYDAESGKIVVKNGASPVECVIRLKNTEVPLEPVEADLMGTIAGMIEDAKDEVYTNVDETYLRKNDLETAVNDILSANAGEPATPDDKFTDYVDGDTSDWSEDKDVTFKPDDGSDVTVQVGPDDTIDDVLESLNEELSPDYEASFDEAKGKIVIKKKATQEEVDYTIEVDDEDVTPPDNTGLLDTVNEMIDSKVSAAMDVVDETYVKKVDLEDAVNEVLTGASKDDTLTKDDKFTDYIDKEAAAGESEKDFHFKVGGKDYTVSVEPSDTIEDVLGKLNEQMEDDGYEASFDEETGKIVIKKTDSSDSTDADYTIEDDDGEDVTPPDNSGLLDTITGMIDEKVGQLAESVENTYVKDSDLERRVNELLGVSHSDQDKFGESFGVDFGEESSKDVEFEVDDDTTVSVEVTPDNTIKDVIDELNKKLGDDYEASYDEETGGITITEKESGESKDFTVTVDDEEVTQKDTGFESTVNDMIDTKIEAAKTEVLDKVDQDYLKKDDLVDSLPVITTSQITNAVNAAFAASMPDFSSDKEEDEDTDQDSHD